MYVIEINHRWLTNEQYSCVVKFCNRVTFLTKEGFDITTFYRKPATFKTTEATEILQALQNQ